MSNLKKITEVPVVENVENINLIANSNGTAVQVAANQIGAQADWNETDESSPAFIMNKPTSLGGGVVMYGIYRGIYDVNGNSVTWEEFAEAFHNGVVRYSYDVPPVENCMQCGTIIGYTTYGTEKRLYGIMENSIKIEASLEF